MPSRRIMALLILISTVGTTAAIPPAIVRQEMRGYFQHGFRIAASVRCAFFEAYEVRCEGQWRCRPSIGNRRTACPVPRGTVDFTIYTEFDSPQPSPPARPAPGGVIGDDGSYCTMVANVPYQFPAEMLEVPGLYGTMACFDAGGQSVLSQQFGLRTTRAARIDD